MIWFGNWVQSYSEVIFDAWHLKSISKETLALWYYHKEVLLRLLRVANDFRALIQVGQILYLRLFLSLTLRSSEVLGS